MRYSADPPLRAHVRCTGLESSEGSPYTRLHPECQAWPPRGQACLAHIKDHSDRQWNRWLHPIERLALQGLKPEIGAKLPTEQATIRAAGNAYPPHLLVA